MLQKLKLDQFKTPRAGLPTNSDNSTNQHQTIYASERAPLLFGCYRKGDANDPETYVAAITAVLADYPTDVIRDVTDPRRGLPSKLDWPPTVREVKSACEEIAGPRRRAAEWERGAKAIRERVALPPPPRPTREQIEAKLGRSIGGGAGRTVPLTAKESAEFQAAHNITAEQWATIPDATPRTS